MLCWCTQVGACDPVTVDACQSYGSGGRPLTFTFLLTSPQVLPPSLLSQLPFESSNCSITLPGSALPPGAAFTVTVKATNFLQRTSVGLVSFRRCFEWQKELCRCLESRKEQIGPGGWVILYFPAKVALSVWSGWKIA